ncbi:hypothetical protein C0989_005623 [Termitomyces sp. Mn162]|nr:hypothetical protein C0989_005623 [Termitomyces sp. Mn162]
MAARSTTLRWGIISTGNIATCFVKVAAVGSRSVEKAREFINDIAGGDESIKVYGTYDEVYTDKDVDAIYIGTPHTYHYENALDAMKAGKHVLCEKPVTSNAAELRSLLAAAKEYNVFFMEAMWTRFQPLTLEAIVALYENPLNKLSHFTNISASMLKTPLTNVDQNTSFTVTFAGADLAAQAILSCSINLNAQNPGVNIRFERGTISISAPIYCPKEYRVTYFGQDGQIIQEERKVFQYVGGGWHFQADEVARCVRDGKKESALWGHNKSLLEMEIFDEVRRQGGYTLPKGVEKVTA